MKNNHIVLTTIYIPSILFDLQKNLEQYGHLDCTVCWVVGDNKTPAICADLCKEVTYLGLETHYLDIAAQDEWGRRFPDFYHRIPYNNESRRNIGYLHALEHGCERLISIDDDNFPTSDDFVGGHMNTGRRWDDDIIEEPSGFHNICEYLEIEPNRQIFPRGFPFGLRENRNEPCNVRPPAGAQVGVTLGLWLKDPDVDATTWLNGKVESKAYRGPSHFMLSQSTWSPINTQNTSVIRELIPAFLCVPMGYPVPGGRIERYGDIWGGYFLQTLMSGTPYHICIGHPIVEHRRNPHNYLDDLRHEFWGMVLTDWMVTQLRESFQPTSRSIVDRVAELSAFLVEVSSTELPNWCPTEVRDFISETAITLELWAEVCRKLL
ncbi:hypothetical protein ACFL6S_15125 [Candidatus Poribacteria bacterium]